MSVRLMFLRSDGATQTGTRSTNVQTPVKWQRWQWISRVTGNPVMSLLCPPGGHKGQFCQLTRFGFKLLRITPAVRRYKVLYSNAIDLESAFFRCSKPAPKHADM